MVSGPAWTETAVRLQADTAEHLERGGEQEASRLIRPERVNDSSTYTSETMALDPSCEAAYGEVFSDTNPTTWCTLGQDGRKLVKIASGTGGLAELTARWKDDEVSSEISGVLKFVDLSSTRLSIYQVSFSLLRHHITDDGGDSKRVKFVYFVW